MLRLDPFRSSLRALCAFLLCCMPQALSGRDGTETARSEYVLGPDDQITIHAVNLEEIQDKAVQIDLRGYIDVPLIGRVQAAGKTAETLETELSSRLSKYVKHVSVNVTITAYSSRPVSVLGAVNSPGVYKLQGQDTIVQILSRAGGLRPDASNTVEITRQKSFGEIPLSTASLDPTGQFYVAKLGVRNLMDAKNPVENITLKPNDVVSIPRAQLVYVMGAVRKPGGFVLQERATLSVLQALSLAEGLDGASKAQNSRIIRTQGTDEKKEELPVDVKKILSGKGADVPLLANDILFVPTSTAKKAGVRAVEAVIQLGTGLAIYRP